MLSGKVSLISRQVSMPSFNGQQNVHNHNVRLEFLGRTQYLLPVAGVPNDFKVPGAFQHLLQPDPHYLVMVGEEDPNPFS